MFRVREALAGRCTGKDKVPARPGWLPGWVTTEAKSGTNTLRVKTRSLKSKRMNNFKSPRKHTLISWSSSSFFSHICGSRASVRKKNAFDSRKDMLEQKM